MTSYATVEEYRLDSGDTETSDERITAVLAQQSAKLRMVAGIKAKTTLNEDALSICRLLVTDSARKALKPPTIDGLGAVEGVTQTSFTADGFSGSYTLQNPSGVAYFDQNTLCALKKFLGTSQQCGTICPGYGVRR
jgi:hypothetical protein